MSVFFFLLPFAQTTNFTNGSGVFLWFLMLHCDYYWLYFLLTWNNVLQVLLHLPLSFWPIRNELLSLWSIPPNSHHVNLRKIWGPRSVKYIHTWLNLSSLASFFWSLLYTLNMNTRKLNILVLSLKDLWLTKRCEQKKTRVWDPNAWNTLVDDSK